MRRNVVRITVALIAALLVVVAAGCGNNSGSGDAGGGNGVGGRPSGKVYSFNQPISFEGGEFTFTKADSYTQVDKRFEDNQFHTPENGAYVTAYYTFKGDAVNESAGVDSAIFVLRDSKGNSWTMVTAISNGPASDLAGIMKLDTPGMQRWNDPEPEDTVVMFDVPAAASGFTINLVRTGDDGKKITEATVPLGF